MTDEEIQEELEKAVFLKDLSSSTIRETLARCFIEEDEPNGNV